MEMNGEKLRRKRWFIDSVQAYETEKPAISNSFW